MEIPEIVAAIIYLIPIAIALIYRSWWKQEERERISDLGGWLKSNQELNRVSKELEATKAELELYKNHQSETYKLLSAEAKVSTSGGVMGGYAMLNVYEFAVINKARYTFTLRGESYIGWGQEGNVIKALPMDANVSTPEILNETIYIAFG